MTDVVEIEGLTKRYGELTAVEDVFFTVRAGRVVGLLGRNGAGKTTTLRMLLGLARPTSGRATLFGHPYAQLPRAAHRVGVSIDGIGPSGAGSGRTDLRIWAKILGLSRARVDDILEQVGLAGDAHRKLKDYSQGMRQRHALATALLADPELLILDEPANGLDPDGIRWLRELLRSLADEGRTVLVSSHILAEIEQLADDIVILQKTLRYSGTAAELTNHGTVSLESRFFDLAGTAAKGSTHA
ncbi:ABC transporter ATP-binding protein [Streptomyces liangshanensis]|uniref:ATP-binding cassette domain-containing protein n=1 Tax=Streptomyces liangshanensis TaxID=2717324 RepID=A0A6G9H0X3_9ACTN|nr:ATP-binding cassette domain-containing protein [Streptomyces liangshanensis]QIQ03939.1 ATP-binding cassette domain-containing protein [Streptomyces liangshanensis]